MVKKMNKETKITILLISVVAILALIGFVTKEILFFYLFAGMSIISLTVIHYFAMEEIRKKKKKGHEWKIYENIDENH